MPLCLNAFIQNLIIMVKIERLLEWAASDEGLSVMRKRFFVINWKSLNFLQIKYATHFIKSFKISPIFAYFGLLRSFP